MFPLSSWRPLLTLPVMQHSFCDDAPVHPPLAPQDAPNTIHIHTYTTSLEDKVIVCEETQDKGDTAALPTAEDLQDEVHTTYGEVAPGETPTNDGVHPYAAFLEAMEKRIAGQPKGMGVSFLDIVNRRYLRRAMHVCVLAMRPN